MQRICDTEKEEKAIRTAEAISKTRKRKFASGELHVWNEGLTKETDERVRANAKSIEQGFTSGKHQIWNKGLTKETDERVRGLAEATQRTMKQDFASGKLQPWLKGLTKETDERVKRRAKASSVTIQQKFASGELQIWNKGLTKETDTRVAESIEKQKITKKLLWQDPEYAQEHSRASRRGMRKRPTRPEIIAQTVLHALFPNEYKYVGNGEVWLGVRNPDFININGQKKIIEVFGDYWHRNDSVEERVEYFRQYGYDTLIIWEKDLHRNLSKVTENIIKFHKQLREQWEDKK